jgi:hypothetical protein
LINQKSLITISLSVGICVLITCAILYFSAAIFTGKDPFIESEIDARLNYYLKLTAFILLLPGVLLIVGSRLISKHLHTGRALLISGALLITLFPLIAIWQTHKVFGFSPILIVLVIGWLMITAIFAAFLNKLKRF